MASVPGGGLAASLAGAPLGEQGPSWQPHEVLRQHIQVLNSEHAPVPLGDLRAQFTEACPTEAHNVASISTLPHIQVQF
jgi:hypothetical protein